MKSFAFTFLVMCFLNVFGYAEEYQRVYLATYPRSGNTWTRQLIEEATGILTFTVYKNFKVQDVHYPCLGYSQEGGVDGRRRQPFFYEPVVIKTHFPVFPNTDFDLKPYFKVIRIIRNPIDSFYSFYRFKGNSKESKIPKEDLVDQINKWKLFHNYWDSCKDVLTIRYEDLLNNCLECITVIIEEIGYQVTNEDLERAVMENLPFGSELKSIDFFTDEDIELIRKELHGLMEKYGYQV